MFISYGIGFRGEEIMQSFQAHEALHHCQVIALCKNLYLVIMLHLNIFHIVTIRICYILSYKFCIVA
jgi:hypothetical protein